MRYALFSIFTLLFVPLATAQSGGIRVAISSFSNDPVVEGGRLERTELGLRVRLTVRFLNEGLFRTGVEAVSFDRPGGPAEGKGSLKVLYLRQKTNPAGVPDIYMPVTKQVVIALAATEGLKTVAVLNVARKFLNDADDLPVHTFEVARAEAGRIGGGEGEIVVQATEMMDGRRLPTVTDVALASKRSGAGIRYQVEFTILTPGGPLRGEDVSVEIRKQTLSDSPPTTADWLFISIPGGPDKPGGGRGEDRPQPRSRFSTEVPAGSRRVVVLGNHVRGPDEADRGPFQVLKVR